MVSLRFPFLFSQPSKLPNTCSHAHSRSFSATTMACAVAAAGGGVAISQNFENQKHPFFQNALKFIFSNFSPTNHSSPIWASLSLADNSSPVVESRTGSSFPSILNDSRRLVGIGLGKKSVLGLKNIDVYAFGADCCSEQVEIIFSALRGTICEIGDKAFTWQARSVTSHVIEIWLDLLKSMLREAEWVSDESVPTIDEYITNGYVSFALGPIVLPTLYLVGPKLSEEVVGNPEFHNLYKLMSTCGRLLNDIQSFKREAKEGKLNAVLLHMIHGSGVITEEEAIEEMKDIAESRRRELLRLVLQEKDSMVPRACKDLFWKMIKVLHLFYMKNDGFTSDEEMINSVKAVLHKPVVLSEF